MTLEVLFFPLVAVFIALMFTDFARKSVFRIMRMPVRVSDILVFIVLSMLLLTPEFSELATLIIMVSISIFIVALRYYLSDRNLDLKEILILVGMIIGLGALSWWLVPKLYLNFPSKTQRKITEIENEYQRLVYLRDSLREDILHVDKILEEPDREKALNDVKKFLKKYEESSDSLNFSNSHHFTTDTIKSGD